MAYIKKSTKKILCKQCSEEFLQKVSYQKYCSKECNKKFHGVPTQIKIFKTCKVCGDQFMSRCHNGKYCSHECRSIANSKMRNYPSQKQWLSIREFILERDNFSCVDCKKQATVVHHKKFVCDGGNNDPENLESLCDACHGKRHKIVL